ncbi:MAG: EamA family transporter, partial [Phycisphaerales bacterium]
MSLFAVALVLGACFTHAVWNLLSKRIAATPAFFWVANAAAIVLTAPLFALTVAGEVPHLPGRVWLCVAAAGVFEGLYFVFLAWAYRHGDVSVVYPLARAAPIFLILAVDLMLGRFPTGFAAVGMVLVGVGCFILPLRRLRIGPDGLAWRNYANRGSLWAGAVGLCISGYSVTDNYGVDLIQAAVPELRGAFLYGCLVWVSAATVLLVGVLLSEGAGAIARAWRTERRNSIIVGVLLFSTYLLILWAYAHTEVVAYAAGLR